MSARTRAAVRSEPGAGAAVRVRHEGLVGWVARMVRSGPSAVAGVVVGFVREVGDVAATVVRPLTRRAAASPAARPARPNPLRGFRRPARPSDEPVLGSGRRIEPAHGGVIRTRASDRKRQLLRRRLRAIAALVAVVVAIVAWRTIPHAGVFRVQHVEIVGASSVSDLDVRRRIDDELRSATIYDIDSDAIERDVRQFAFVRSVSVDSHFPSGITVRVVEHQPLALGYDGGSKHWWLVSPDGRVLARAEVEDWKGRVPVVRLESRNLAPGRHLSSEPAIALLLARADDSTLVIESIDVGTYTVTARLESGMQVRFGRPQQLRTKLAVAQRMLSIMRTKRQDWAYLDVSVPAEAVPCPRAALCAAIPPPDDQAVRLASAARAAAAENRATGAPSTADQTAAADDSTVAEPAPTVDGPTPTPSPVAGRKPEKADPFDVATSTNADTPEDN